jgi:DNA-directed RNA polymerase subunit F
MANFKILSSEPVHSSQVLEVVNEKAKSMELTYREQKMQEYLNARKKISKKDFEKAKEELTELKISRIEPAHIIKILEIMPQNGTELRAIVSHSGTVLVDENVKKVLDVLKKYY